MGSVEKYPSAPTPTINYSNSLVEDSEESSTRIQGVPLHTSGDARAPVLERKDAR